MEVVCPTREDVEGVKCSLKVGELPGPVAAMCKLALVLLVIAVGTGWAQNQAQLTVKMNVQSSIQLVFQNTQQVGQPSNCALINANTSNVGLDLGARYLYYRNSSSCAGSPYVDQNTYAAESYFYVYVTAANTTSTSYSLAAEISTPPPTGVTWLINNQNSLTPLNSNGYTTIATRLNYNWTFDIALRVQVSNTVPDQALQETVTFQATAN